MKTHQNATCQTLYKTIYGVGIDDSDYQIRKESGGKVIWTCPYYQRWVNMIARCYSKNQRKYTPSYRGCRVCKEWLTFSNFKSWMETQDWEGKELDKDLFGDGLVYGPSQCCFITKHMNLLLSAYPRSKGFSFMKNRGKWRAYYNHPITRKHKHIGLFDTEEDAKRVAKVEKDKVYKYLVQFVVEDTTQVKERFLQVNELL